MVRANFGYFILCLVVLGFVLVKSVTACELNGESYLQDLRTLPPQSFVALFDKQAECVSCAEYEDQARACERKFGTRSSFAMAANCDQCMGNAAHPDECRSVCH